MVQPAGIWFFVGMLHLDWGDSYLSYVPRMDLGSSFKVLDRRRLNVGLAHFDA